MQLNILQMMNIPGLYILSMVQSLKPGPSVKFVENIFVCVKRFVEKHVKRYIGQTVNMEGERNLKMVLMKQISK